MVWCVNGHDWTYNKKMIWLIALILGTAFAAILLWFGTRLVLLIPFLHDPVFVPSKDDALETMLELAEVRPGQKVADLGSGDGKILIALAHQGIETHGYENSIHLLLASRSKIKKLHLQDKAKVFWKSFWSADLSQYDVVVIYARSLIMERLEKKLLVELKPGAKVVSNTFQFPHWPLKKQIHNIYLYEKESFVHL